MSDRVEPLTAEELAEIEQAHIEACFPCAHGIDCEPARLLATIAAKDEEIKRQDALWVEAMERSLKQREEIRRVRESNDLFYAEEQKTILLVAQLRAELAQKTEDMSKDAAEFSYLREKVRGLRETANNWIIIARTIDLRITDQGDDGGF